MLFPRFEEARGALFRALSSRELYGAPVLMLANKQDAPDAQPPAAVQQMLGLDELKVPLRVQVQSPLQMREQLEGVVSPCDLVWRYVYCLQLYCQNIASVCWMLQ